MRPRPVIPRDTRFFWDGAEAVRRIRGVAVNQIAAVEHVLVTAGTGVPTSGLILGRG